MATLKPHPLGGRRTKRTKQDAIKGTIDERRGDFKGTRTEIIKWKSDWRQTQTELTLQITASEHYGGNIEKGISERKGKRKNQNNERQGGSLKDRKRIG